MVSSTTVIRLTLALVLLLSRSGLPGHLVVVVQAVLAVVAAGVVVAVAGACPKREKETFLSFLWQSSLFLANVSVGVLSMHHPLDVLVLLLLPEAALGVPVAGAGAAHRHVVDGVIVFLLQDGERKGAAVSGTSISGNGKIILNKKNLLFLYLILHIPCGNHGVQYVIIYACISII